MIKKGRPTAVVVRGDTEEVVKATWGIAPTPTSLKFSYGTMWHSLI